MKGQIMEMMGFLILAVTITGIILLIKYQLVGNYERSFSALSGRQETEGLRSGINSILSTTEEKSGKSMVELIGTAVHNEKDVIYFGPVIGDVDVKEEIEWRFDSILGHGKWYLKAKPPKIIPPIQVIMILDSSASLCDDVKEIKQNLLPTINDLIKDKKNITATIYMLPGQGEECCGEEKIKMKCEGDDGINIEETSYLHCLDFETGFGSGCTRPPENEEDWGRGLSCAIQKGPNEGWVDDSIKVGIVISDEVSYGSELKDDSCDLNQENQDSLDIGINAAKNFGLKVFSIKTNTGKSCCNECENCQSECNICLMWYDDVPDWQDTWVERRYFTKVQCSCDQELENQMVKISEETGGKFYTVQKAEEVSEAIREILTEIESKEDYFLEAGNSRPEEKNIRSYTITIPVPYTGEYTDVNIYYWS